MSINMCGNGSTFKQIERRKRGYLAMSRYFANWQRKCIPISAAKSALDTSGPVLKMGFALSQATSAAVVIFGAGFEVICDQTLYRSAKLAQISTQGPVFSVTC